MTDVGGMVDNNTARASLLYLAWAGNEAVPVWEALSAAEQNKWLRVQRYVDHCEVDLCAKLARDSYRKRFEARLLTRLQKWDEGK